MTRSHSPFLASALTPGGVFSLTMSGPNSRYTLRVGVMPILSPVRRAITYQHMFTTHRGTYISSRMLAGWFSTRGRPDERRFLQCRWPQSAREPVQEHIRSTRIALVP
jgi:hypothetical protein